MRLMLPHIRTALLTHKVSRPALRDPKAFTLTKVLAIIAHWTANTGRGANAVANRNYFNMGSRYASAHYCVDSEQAVRCLPEREVAYHVGAARYRPVGERLKKGYPTPNYTTIGFEMCVNSDGDWNKTLMHSIDLAAWLLRKHGLGIDDLHRHYDITGKDCPRMFLADVEWEKYRTAVKMQMDTIPDTARYYVISKGLNVRVGPGTQYGAVMELKAGEPVLVAAMQDGWANIAADEWVNARYLSTYG